MVFFLYAQVGYVNAPDGMIGQSTELDVNLPHAHRYETEDTQVLPIMQYLCSIQIHAMFV